MVNVYPSTVTLEDSTCPNGCVLNDEFVLSGHDRLHGIAGEFAVVRCRQCDLERTNPRPTPETIGTYYPLEYSPYHSSTTTEQAQTKIKSLFRCLLGLEARQLPPLTPRRMLEVGCASGGYMAQMQRAGWDVEGIEFSDNAASVARTKGFKVQSSSLEDAESPVKKFDVIAAWMVLEHLHQPVQCLKRMHAWVTPSGYLVASVPDTNSLAKKLFKQRCYDLHLPNHLFHYTPKTLESVLNNAGWKLERVVWQKNCNTLLWSAHYWAMETQHPNFLKLVQWVRTSNGAAKIRLFFGWLLGVTHQSGRIEFWARPISNKDDK